MTHDAGDREAADRLTEAFRNLDGTIREAMRSGQGSGNTQIIKIDAGGFGVWAALWMASLCCAVMLTMTFVSRADQIDQKRRLDVANDKLSVILQWSPELAKKVDDSTNHTKGEKTP
jgi:hypothetical protein